MKKYFLTACGLLLALSSLLAQPYTNPALPIPQRVQDLLSRMTTEEKVAQLRSTWSAYPRINDALLADPHRMDSLFGHGILLEFSLYGGYKWNYSGQKVFQVHDGLPADPAFGWNGMYAWRTAPRGNCRVR